MSMRTFKLGISKAKKAVDFDNDENYDEASRYYKEAMEILMEFAKVTKNIKLRHVCLDRIEQYLKRVKEIKGIYEYEVPRPRTSSEPSGKPLKPRTR